MNNIPLREIPLRFKQNGTFRIMHITDTHLDFKNQKDSIALISKALDDEQPDIVILTGDIACADKLNEVLFTIKNLMSVFDEKHIPVAVTFGNHDSESGVISRNELMRLYNSFYSSVAPNDFDDNSNNCGTYNLPVYSGKDNGCNDIAFNLWVFDSGDYDECGKYANTSEAVVSWYVKKSEELEQQNGKKIPSMAFQHIIVPEIYDSLAKVSAPGPFVYEGIYRKGQYFMLNPDNTEAGVLLEQPCCGYYNHGQFDAFLKRGDVMAVFSGHDHMSTFRVNRNGIRIENTLSTRYKRDSFSTQYGYRIIDLNENELASYGDRSVHWYDKYTIPYVMKNKEKWTREFYNLAMSVAYYGTYEKLKENLSYKLCEIIKKRKAVY